jgi:ABC-type multidrug transport system fused ATPase/permease subunit
MHPHQSIGLHKKTLSGFIWSQQRNLRTYLFWRVMSVLAITPFPVISQKIVDKAIPDDDLNGVIYYTMLSLLLLLAHFVSMKIAVSNLSTQSQEIFRKLRSRIFHKLNFMHFGFLDSVQTGRLLSKYAFDTNNIEATVIQIVTSIIPELLRSALLILALTYINIWLLAIVLISIPIFAFVRLYFFKQIAHNNREVRIARERMTGQANEFISAIKLVRGYGQEDQARDQMGVISDEYSNKRISQMQLNQSLGYILFTVVSALSLFAVALCGWLVIGDKMTMGAMVALVGALPVCLAPVNMITQFSMQYLLGAESYKSIKELMDSAYVEEWQGQCKLEHMAGGIEFRNVSFAYDKEKEHRTIVNFSTVIRPGEHVAFVGPSGSGKSTIVSLMLGFYAPTDGEILVDGVPQAELAIREFRQECAIVMQDNLLLSGTIMDNIRFGRASATNEEVREAARHASALEFIEELPEGFNTKVGERGVSLSGGQRQRIAIARALLRNPKILILDEATSALDYESEKSVQAAIDYLAQGRTTITIAHRLSTIRSADRIIVLKAGECISEGSWDELAAQDGAFKDLLDAQT